MILDNSSEMRRWHMMCFISTPRAIDTRIAQIMTMPRAEAVFPLSRLSLRLQDPDVSLDREAEAGPDAKALDFPGVRPLREWYLPVKHTLDFVLAVILMIATAPVTLAAGLLIRLTSRGPIFYRQVRLGKDGRPFRLVKLRTMQDNAESQTGPAWSTGNDSRVTPLGKLLRQTHIDEFPQLWNVLRGEMSLIGPRPERPEFVVRLEAAVPYYGSRMNVRPGITGLAQLRLPPDDGLESVRQSSQSAGGFKGDRPDHLRPRFFDAGRF